MEISTFKAKCSACKSEFPYPELSEFAYGEFIFASTGGTFCLFTAIGHPVSELVEASLPKGASFPAVCAFIADPVEGQKLTTQRACPICQSKQWEFWHGERVGSVTISEAAFERFLSLPRPEQANAVLEAAAKAAA
jgi:Zn finger protein HypA/HybF involved in hydrogenase expression